MIIKNFRGTKEQRGKFAGFKDCIEESVYEYLPIIKEQKLVHNFDEFLELLIVNIKTCQTSYGGLSRKGNPYITIARHNRFWNKDLFIKEVLERNPLNQRYPWSEQYICALKNKWMFAEYARINNDPIIGGFISNIKERHVACIVAHELSHAMDYFDGDKSSHGEKWQQRYKVLRTSKYLKRWSIN
jgi:hypothetical protein